MGTEANVWAGKIRWQDDTARSEGFRILDGTLISFFFPGANIPGGPFTFEGAINREADFRGVINDEAGAPITLTAVPNEWVSLDTSLAEVMPFHHLWLVSTLAQTAGIYEARYQCKRV